MTLAPLTTDADAATADEQAAVQLTLSRAEAHRLRMVLPSLLRALAERPTLAPRQRERRRQAHAALESLLSALTTQQAMGEEGSG